MYIQAIRSQTMDTQCIDNFNCQRLVCGFRECTVNDILQLSTGSNNTVDGYVTLEQSVGFDCRPIIIKRDDARLVLWHITVKNVADCHRDVFQNMSIFYQVNFVEHVNVGRMDWEQVHKLIHPGRHACVKHREFFQMLTDQSLLLRRFLQNTLRHNIRCCLFGDDHLCKTIRDMLQIIRYKTEPRIVKNLFLYAKDNSKLALGAHLTQRTEKFQIQNDFTFIPRR